VVDGVEVLVLVLVELVLVLVLVGLGVVVFELDGWFEKVTARVPFAGWLFWLMNTTQSVSCGTPLPVVAEEQEVTPLGLVHDNCV